MKPRLSLLVAALLLSAGLLQASKPKLYTPTPAVEYAVFQEPSQLPFTVSVEAAYEPAPELLATWKTRKIKDDLVAQHCQAVAAAVTRDIATSGLFESVAAPSDPRTAYKIKLACQTVQTGAQLSIKVTAAFVRSADGVTEWTFVRSTDLGPVEGPHADFAPALRVTMIFLHTDIAQGFNLKFKQEKEKALLDALRAAPLADLLVAADPNTKIARERNRALVAAKNEQLPALLRDKKTEELSALVTKIEQTILDLDHEAEVAKDKAQESAAVSAPSRGGGDGGERPMPEAIRARVRGGAHAASERPTLDELRGLSICYRERIELLKPIATAIREEIANRSR